MSMKREDVRLNFPHGTAIADLFKSTFGRIKLLYVEENGQTIGKKSAEKGVKVSEIELYGNAFVQKKTRGKIINE